MKRILFQGDSITDAGRAREDGFDTGRGYPTLVSAKLGFEYAGEYEFLNRGISGNRSIDVLARVKEDIINLKPDVMSLLIGINDVWHELARRNGVDAQLYAKYCDILITQVKTDLPDIKIMILEPFVLKASATEGQWELFREETEKRAAGARALAKRHKLVFVPLMKTFDEAQQRAEAGYWLKDGVHPTSAGHELIAREWINAFKNEILPTL